MIGEKLDALENDDILDLTLKVQSMNKSNS
jgi:hypothetical protein